VVSNHPDFGELAASYRIPFHHIPVTPQAKAAAESHLLEVIDGTGADLIVLARYMQILSGEVCKRVEGRMINIHHSFLPSFKGAKPYHQAHARGVKLVGATGAPRRGRPGRRGAGPGPRGDLARRAPGVAQRRPDRSLSLTTASP